MDFEKFKKIYLKEDPIYYPNKVPTEPIVSIIVLAYQHVNFIKECLDGILTQQTDFEYEVILGEDDSIDGTRDLCIEYAEKYPDKIRLFLHHSINKIKVQETITGNFNIIYNFFQTKGKYIAICDGDDVWHDKSKLQKQFDFLEDNTDYSICYHNFEMINENGDFIESDKASPLRFDLSQEQLKCPWIHPSTLTIFFRNNLKLPKEITKVLNLDIFIYSLLGEIGKGKFISDINYSKYRIHSGGIWSQVNKEKSIVFKIHAYKQLSKYYFRKGDKNAFKKFNKQSRKLKNSLLLYYFKKRKFKKMFKSFFYINKFSR
ncbi:glycosyltransferase family 2 protein [Salegentibacter maritimus]|uniref:glycosyltransferase family 2 protein n=1 Tax=Salegentibacter maritimus TaxID=2794347 RepID=UPI0018E45620|nr:glycosyltransferase [Salegentibacter maritimus]MBI6117334.1 glycosyltransferase [Salegentibacter maritimus]